jgi:NarL family two-component system sensor histidine kinase LiaS
MSIGNSLTKRSRQLRWKLTLTYTVVTVGALLAVVLVFFVASPGLLISQLRSGYFPTRIIEAAAVDYVPVLRLLLEKSPPDQEAIAIWLERFRTTSTLLHDTDGVPVIIDPGEFEMLVIGSDGKLLGATSSGFLGSGRIGDQFDEQLIPGVGDLVQSALTGEKDAERLYMLVNSERNVVMAVPIWDAADEQALGVLVISVEVPTMRALLGEQVPTLGVILLLVTLVAGLIGTAFGFLAARGLVHRLDRLAEATLAWSQGDFTVFVDDPSGDELGQLAQRLNHMAQQLQHLLDTRRELAVMEERNRLARDLHDSAKQQAFGAAAQISAVKALLKGDLEAAEAHIEEAERLTYDLRQELTTLIQELRPAALEDKGLASAVREYAEDWSRQNGIELEVRVQGERSLPLDIEQTVFRIVQEALSNVARHSEASSVEIGLVYTKRDIACTISDDGLGFDPDKKRRGFGLRSMQERADALGGTLKVESVVGAGTCISFAVPLSESPESEEDRLYG